MKSMKRHALLLFVALLLPGYLYAADFGIGVNIDTAAEDGVGYGILVPIRFDNLVLEPEVSFSEQRDKNDDSASGQIEQDQTSFALGLGVYVRKQLLANTESYVGARLGYRSLDYTNKRDDSGTSYRYDYKMHALFLIPTVGIQYFFSEKFSIGCDIGLKYSDGEYKDKDQMNGVSSTSDGDYSQWTTTSRVAVRGYF